MSEIAIITIFFHPKASVMQSINVLTISGAPQHGLDLVKAAEDGKRYFPTGIWDDARYLGSLSLEHDVKIATGGETFGAFLFEKLTERIRRIKDSHKLVDLLLGITPDPIVAMYYCFDGKRFKRTLYLVHDYMTETVGVVSLFQINEGNSSKVVAHGLGHSQGLRHHAKPIDLMYHELLRIPMLKVEGFCKACLQRLTKNKRET